jgi:signal peptidase I
MSKVLYEYSFKLRREFRRAITRTAIFILLVIACLVLFLHFVLFSVSVHTGSMAPDMESGQHIFVSPLFSNRLPGFSLERGDIVLAFPYPKPEISLNKRIISEVVTFATAQRITLYASPSTTETALISRVLGFPGDTIYMENYVLHIRPAGAEHFLTEFELIDRDYNIRVEALPAGWDGTLAAAGSLPVTTLGDDQYFLLCDDRTSSMDSRIFGVVGVSQIMGRALLRFFPLGVFSLL